jgi:FPC/CPF motif-containing protein YcgG
VRRNVKKTTEEFLIDLENKGFKFQEDAIGFIYFGKKYTDAPDELVNSAIEITLKAQKQFDSSFYMSILERLHSQQISSRKEALRWMEKQGLA